MTMIYGPTGSGKSSLLSAILGDMHRISGGVSILEDNTFPLTGRTDCIPIGYAPQLGKSDHT